MVELIEFLVAMGGQPPRRALLRTVESVRITCGGIAEVMLLTKYLSLLLQPSPGKRQKLCVVPIQLTQDAKTALSKTA